MQTFSICDTITQVVNKLFVYTDRQAWGKLQTEVFAEHVIFDMSSMGMDKKRLSAIEICELWREGFKGIDSINHLAGNYLIDIQEDSATVLAYATATHYKKLATNGKTREFVGSYDLHLKNIFNTWLIDEFTYHLKYSTGNVDFT